MTSKEELLFQQKSIITVTNNNIGTDEPIQIGFSDQSSVSVRPSELREMDKHAQISDDNKFTLQMMCPFPVF